MAVFHDEVEIEDFEWDATLEAYVYPCPCGDRFQISKVSREGGLHGEQTKKLAAERRGTDEN